jgi:hypothetical protein
MVESLLNTMCTVYFEMLANGRLEMCTERTRGEDWQNDLSCSSKSILVVPIRKVSNSIPCDLLNELDRYNWVSNELE